MALPLVRSRPMTGDEARDRAKAIWGESILSLALEDDGTAYVDTDPALARRRLRVTNAKAERDFDVHRLDANGHPTCHVACKDYENEELL
jgi:hypothetical protein